ncbi:MAG: phosphotransferase [Pseudomonadota bacterium]|nr:phosphotransferase [Pseudomonadota bacterium]
MNKIDLHIHTVPSPLDADFTFSIEKLNEYVEVASLDCIAITNHNLFDKDQFKNILDQSTIPVFPGIEIDLEGGQILVIGDSGDLNDFDGKCAQIKSHFYDSFSTPISVKQLKDIFGDLSKYLLIPHYYKSPAVKEETLVRLSPHVVAGEVSSLKKFIYCMNRKEALTPVYFSDCRIHQGLSSFSIRQTYLDCDEISLPIIKHCLRDKAKVALSEKDGHKLFQVFEDGQQLSTGLNVIVGERSSGKSYTLRRIYENFDNVRYLEQFSLVARDDAEDQRRFSEYLSQKRSVFSKDYLAELQRVIEDVADIDLEKDERSVESYIASLLQHAEEIKKQDAYSKAKLYSDEPFQAIDQKGLMDLIGSTKNLVRNEEFREIIDKHLPLENLKALYVELMRLYAAKEEERLKKGWVNELIQQVKDDLQFRTAAPPISGLEPYNIVMNLKKVEKFREIALLARKARQIERKHLRGFDLVAEVGAFNGAGELKKVSGTKMKFSDAYEAYDDPYQYLQALREIGGPVVTADFSKYFVKIDYRVLNKDGFDASGGERSEYFLLQAIEDAQSADMLLIDEPESSFDNIFLKNKVNEIIKDIAKMMPVVLVTHNNTVGASIRPDYLLCTRKEMEAGEPQWRIYSGFPTNKELLSTDGKSISTWEITMGCLEAGALAYEERREGYENLKN